MLPSSQNCSTKSFLIIDDDEVFRQRLARAIESRGYKASHAPCGSEALEIARSKPPRYAVVDLCMPGESGLELIAPLKKISAITEVVVLTGFGSIVTAVEAMRLGARSYISKPADADTILEEFGIGEGGNIGVSSNEPSVPELKTVEWEHIQRVLHQCGGNVSRAAKLLGLHRRSLQRKLAKDLASQTGQEKTSS
jgi:two-component system response regulator RegA